MEDYSAKNVKRAAQINIFGVSAGSSDKVLVDVVTPPVSRENHQSHHLSMTHTSEEKAAIHGLMNPSAYTGLYGFHKYWGKKPIEPLRFLILALTESNDLVVDPFVGSGAIAKETVNLGRRFIGGDVNPTAIRLTRFFLQPCTINQYTSAFEELERTLRHRIDSSYEVTSFGVASHLLWQNDDILSIWHRNEGKRVRKERPPTNADLELALSYSSYKARTLRPLQLFQNGRINSFADISWNTLFSGRALRNIELLLNEIRRLDQPLRHAFELTLTAAVGQMSKMVFAITSRGKTKGQISQRIEVGSWVIGYWRPEKHFEINVWNCFESKANKLIKSLDENTSSSPVLTSAHSVIAGNSAVCIEKMDATELVEDLPLDSIKLLITDPPHGDRIPYLELSEMWNAILDDESLYEKEVVVSNAKGRNKTQDSYNAVMNDFFSIAVDRIQNGGFLVLLFNSRRDGEWSAIRGITENSKMNLLGCFPMEYSATSVVQDNRQGSMKTDYILVFAKSQPAERAISLLKAIPGWRSGDME